MSFQYICGKCGESCKNAGGLATHKKNVASQSFLNFLKRAPAKKILIELKPIQSKPRQVKFKSSTPSSISSPDVPSNDILPPKKRPIPPPAPPFPRRDSKLSPFMAPASLTSPDLDKKVSRISLSPHANLHRAQDTISDAK